VASPGLVEAAPLGLVVASPCPGDIVPRAAGGNSRAGGDISSGGGTSRAGVASPHLAVGISRAAGDISSGGGISLP